MAPAIIVNKNTKVQKEMSKVGEELGLLFQVADDLLDVRGSKQSTGKPVQKDRKKGKSTFLNLFGYKKTLEFALERKNMIINKLKKHGRKSDKLVQITDFLINKVLMTYKLLDNINCPSDLRKLSKNRLDQVSKELRSELINVVSETGGHLGAGLGVVELTVALHYVFNTPKDKLVWDVGHQCYPIK